MPCPPQVPISIIPPVASGQGPLVWQNGNQITRLTKPLNPSWLVYDGSVTRWGDGSSQAPVLLPNLQEVSASSIQYNIGTLANGQLAKTGGLPTTIANNLSGGAAGEVVYQVGLNQTGFTAVGTSAQLLQSNGASAPTWIGPNSLAVTATGSTTARTLANRFADVVNVKDFGAVGDGVTDDTAAIQAALNSGAKAVYVPTGRFNHTGLVLPVTTGFCLFGNDVASVLVQKGGSIRYPTRTIYALTALSTIQNIAFDGTAGTANTLDLNYAQTIDVRDVFFTNIPTGFSSIYLNGNSNDGTYCHDNRLINVRIYNDAWEGGYTGLGHSAVRLGPYSSDCLIDGLVVQAGFHCNYCIYADGGALTTTIVDSHPYNSNINVVRLNGYNNDFAFTSCVFDYSVSDVFYVKESSNLRIENSQFQVYNGNGLTLDNSYNTVLAECKFNPLGVPAGYCISEINVTGNTSNTAFNTIVENPTQFTGVFNFIGSTSFAAGLKYSGTYPSLPPPAPRGMIYQLSGSGNSSQAQNTTKYYGSNGIQDSAVATYYPVAYKGYLLSATIWSNTLPASGQNFTIKLYRVIAASNTTVLIGTGVITSSTPYFVTITPTSAVNVEFGDLIYLQSVFSSTSGSSYLRYAITLAA